MSENMFSLVIIIGQIDGQKWQMVNLQHRQFHPPLTDQEIKVFFLHCGYFSATVMSLVVNYS